MIVRGMGVAKAWGTDLGLQPVDFVIDAGALTCVAGRSGSGKSTLLALLTGFADRDDGLLRWAPDLEPVVDAPWTDIAFVPQTLLLLAELSVRENVALGAARPTTNDEVEALLRALALTGLGGRTIDTLSNGQRQRVAVARAVAAHPRLLVVDEPTSHQDAVSAGLVIDALRDEAARGGAVVAASHDPLFIGAADVVIDLDRPV